MKFLEKQQLVKCGACFGQAFPELKHWPISRQEAISHLNLLTNNPSDKAKSRCCPDPCNGPAHLSIMQRQSSPAVAVNEAIQGWNQQTQRDIAPWPREFFQFVIEVIQVIQGFRHKCLTHGAKAMRCLSPGALSRRQVKLWQTKKETDGWSCWNEVNFDSPDADLKP